MLPLVRLGRANLDFEFFTAERARVRILERPGRWMRAEEQARLLEELRSVVRASTTAGDLEYGVLSGDARRWESCILTLVYAPGDSAPGDSAPGERAPADSAPGDSAPEDQRPVAFNALTIMDCELRGRPVEVLHLGLVMIDPSFRARGLSGVLYGLTCFLLFARGQMRPLWISNVTQVPAVFGMVAENFSGVFPSPDSSSRRSFDHLALAREIMARHRSVFGVGPEAGFDADRFVITNSYTGGSDNLKKAFDETARHRHAAYNEMCARELDYARGDDYLQLGQFDLSAARQYMLRQAGRLSFRAVVSRFAFLLLESSLLPVLHWFSPARPLGELRPWKA
jgi:hypothetical protein